MKKFITLYFMAVITGCNTNQQSKKQEVNNMKIGSDERLDPLLDSIIASNAKAEIIAESFEWSEGPVWIV